MKSSSNKRKGRMHTEKTKLRRKILKSVTKKKTTVKGAARKLTADFFTKKWKLKGKEQYR